MKKCLSYLVSIVVLSFSVDASAQIKRNSGGGGGGTTYASAGTSAPATCTPGGTYAFFFDTDDVELYYCSATDTYTLVDPAEAQGLAEVTAINNTSTGNDETNPLEIFGSGGQAAYGTQSFTSSSGDIVIRCKTAAGVNKCDYFRQIDDTFRGGFKDKDGTERWVFDGTTGAVTKETIDLTSADVNVTRTIPVMITLAGCPDGTAVSALDRPGNGATVPTATCLDAGTVEQPYLSFSGSAVNSGTLHLQVPPQFSSLTSASFELLYASAAASPTGNVEWDISTLCRAVTEAIDASYNTAQTITDAVAAQNIRNLATQSSLTMTGCAPGEDLYILISRDGTNDTNNDAALAMRVTVAFTGVE